MHVTLLNSTRPTVNGAAVHTLQLAKYLKERGHTVSLFRRPDSWLAGQADLADVRTFETSFELLPWDISRLLRQLRELNPDVIHTHMSAADQYGAVAKLLFRRPVISTAHAHVRQLAGHVIDRVIATSPDTADFLMKRARVKPSKITVIPNFVDTASLSAPDEMEHHATKEALGIPADAFVIGTVANFMAAKRPADLARAFAKVARQVPNAWLLMIGSRHIYRYTAAFDATMDIIRADGLEARCVFPGERTDATKLLAAFDTFVLTSEREVGPISVLEAMCRGLPVIATRVGMLPQFVENGRTGFIFDTGDVDTLADDLLLLAGDPARRRSFGEAGRARVLENYSIERCCPQIEAVYREILATR